MKRAGRKHLHELCLISNTKKRHPVRVVMLTNDRQRSEMMKKIGFSIASVILVAGCGAQNDNFFENPSALPGSSIGVGPSARSGPEAPNEAPTPNDNPNTFEFDRGNFTLSAGSLSTGIGDFNIDGEATQVESNGSFDPRYINGSLTRLEDGEGMGMALIVIGPLDHEAFNSSETLHFSDGILQSDDPEVLEDPPIFGLNACTGPSLDNVDFDVPVQEFDLILQETNDNKRVFVVKSDELDLTMTITNPQDG